MTASAYGDSKRAKRKKKKDDDEDIIKEYEPSKCQKRVAFFVDWWPIAIFMTVITIYALFGDDIRFLILPPFVDPYFYGLTSFSIFCFGVEVIAACYGKRGYIWSFFFWLDTLSTISMLSDVGWFSQWVQN